MKKRALLSVSDKSGVLEFAQQLESLGFEILSTGGTFKTLTDGGVAAIEVSSITEFPECLDGRVKTLHPAIHAGILAIRSNVEHMSTLENLGIDTIDIVAINLYPFKQTILKSDVQLAEAIENIDIGGPTMLRAAAKNYQDVAVVIDPSDYSKIIAELNNGGEISAPTKFRLAHKVFSHTAHYDTLIADYLSKQLNETEFPETLSLTFEKSLDLRYGENPHQSAIFYKEIGNFSGAITAAEQLHGKELSYNNINDANGALDVVKEFDEPAVVAIKHANPCGMGVGTNIFEAYKRAHDADPLSIFGGIIAANREIDAQTAEEINKIFVEILIAPSFTPEALEILTQKKNIRLLKLPEIGKKHDKSMLDMKKVAGGLLVQQLDTELWNDSDLQVVTEKSPTYEQMNALKFAMKIVKHVKSNAIVLANGEQTVGIGPGQTNRVTALNLALNYAGEQANGAVLASDAFFPFDDCVEAAQAAGIAAIIQPGGSINDQKSIDACNRYGIPMVFTNMRHFKH